MTPTPTLTPTITPSATPSTCSQDLPERLQAGQPGQVVVNSNGPNTPLNVRQQPGTDAARLARLATGVTFTVLDGPVCADGIAWYEIEYGSPAESGWIAEGLNGVYFVEPVG
jgi:hypothetical protein